MEKERTLVLLKPDALQRGLIGKIITKFEDVGLKIIGMKLDWVDKKFAKEHYKEEIKEKHGEKIWKDLLEYITQGPIVAIALEGAEAIDVTRKIVGSTYPNESLPGTIRGDFAHISKSFANTNNLILQNMIHASANQEDAKNEIKLWFKPEEIHSYKNVHDLISIENNTT